jgi:hypothetical protein
MPHPRGTSCALFRRLTATVPILLAAGLLLAPAAAADPGFSTRPRTVEHPPAGSPKLVDLRAGRHAGFDRVVFQIDGPLPLVLGPLRAGGAAGRLR